MTLLLYASFKVCMLTGFACVHCLQWGAFSSLAALWESSSPKNYDLNGNRLENALTDANATNTNRVLLHRRPKAPRPPKRNSVVDELSVHRCQSSLHCCCWGVVLCSIASQCPLFFQYLRRLEWRLFPPNYLKLEPESVNANRSKDETCGQSEAPLGKILVKERASNDGG